MRRSSGILLLVLLIQTGCWHTRVEAAPGTRTGVEHEELQLFTLAGLVPLSGPDGKVCKSGLAYVETEQSFTDILISVGVAAAGGAAGALACSGGTTEEQLGCASAGVTLAPVTFGTRTVRYACTGDRPGLAPPPF